MGTLRRLVVGVSAILLTGAVGTPAIRAQGIGAEVQIEITGGPRPGTYEVTGEAACRAGWLVAEAWELDISGFDADPDVTMVLGSGDIGLDSVVVSFEAGESYYSESVTFSVDDRGSAATISASVEAMSASLDAFSETVDSQLELQVECHTIDRFSSGEPVPSPAAASLAPIPVPSPLGSPPAGATTFHVVVTDGPAAGIWDVWTTEVACTAPDVGWWTAQYIASDTEPTFISVSSSPNANGLHVGFAELTPYQVLYDMAGDVTFEIDDRGDTATLRVLSATNLLHVPGGAPAQPAGQVEVTVECASVMRPGG